VSAVRTAVGKAPKGMLRATRPDDLAAVAIQGALGRVPGLDKKEVEDVIAMMPGVLEVCAVPAPDEHSGEVVRVVIVRKDPSLTKEQVIEHCRKELTGYKIPRHVYFRDELPKTNVGKILRRALRDELRAAAAGGAKSAAATPGAPKHGAARPGPTKG